MILINGFIAENGGDTRDALNVALARLEQAQLMIKRLEAEQNAAPELAEAVISQAKAAANAHDADMDDWAEYLTEKARAALTRAGILEPENQDQ